MNEDLRDGRDNELLPDKLDDTPACGGRFSLIRRFLLALMLALGLVLALGGVAYRYHVRLGVTEMSRNLLAWMASELEEPVTRHAIDARLRQRLDDLLASGVFDALALAGPDGQRIEVGRAGKSEDWIQAPLGGGEWRLAGHPRRAYRLGGGTFAIFFFGFWLVLAVGVVAWLVRHYFAAPLWQLTREVERIGKGERIEKLESSGSDEFQVLACFINRLMRHCDGQRSHLRRALDRVRGSRERLEKVVRERTDALEQTARALRRRELLLQEYAEVTSQRIEARGRIRELMRLACRMFSLRYGMILGARDGAVNVIERYPLGHNPPLPDIAFVRDVLAADGPLARSGNGSENGGARLTSEAAPAAYVALPLAIFDKRNFVLVIASDVAAVAPFSREDFSLLTLFRDWISATLTNEAQARLIHRQKERAQVTLASITEAVITTDGVGIVEYMNPVAEVLTGFSAREAEGRAATEVLRLFSESSGQPIEDPVARCLRTQRAVMLEEDLLLRGREGREYAIEGAFAPIRDRRGELSGSVVILHDVSQAREMAQRLSYHATHDALTGLCNRREFESRLKQAMDSARSGKLRHALLYMDLDQFKIVNDTSGHTAGDHLLKQVAGELQRHIDPEDTLARLGGDEFGVLLLDCDVAHAMLVAHRLREAIRDYRFVWRQRSFEIGISIGLVPLDSSVGHLSQVMSAADTACYAAKNEGRNRVHLYESDDAAVTRHRGMMEWAVTINSALQLNRFELYRQPIRHLESGEDGLHHYEILLRMRREDGSVVEPGHFIPAAERFDLMPAIDRWVVRRMCEYMSLHSEDGETQYAINLSGASVDDEALLDFITSTFIEYDVDPARVCFEITETEAISSLRRAIDLVRELRAIGCHFSLDDFGAGFSSFSYLKNFPLDYLKIDGAFIRDMLDDPVDQAMVKAINDVGHSMGIETIAEYVESEETAALLREIGVDYVQGYWISRPRRLEFPTITGDNEEKEAPRDKGRLVD